MTNGPAFFNTRAGEAVATNHRLAHRQARVGLRLQPNHRLSEYQQDPHKEGKTMLDPEVSVCRAGDHILQCHVPRVRFPRPDGNDERGM